MTRNPLPAAPARVKTRFSGFTGVACTALVILTLILAACGGASQNNQANSKHVLKIGAHVGADFIKSYSPYNPVGANEGIQGMVYETLYFFNISNNQSTPMLATS